MAYADYRCRDKCKNKAFYDANLSYEVLRADEAEESVLENGKKTFYKLGYLGDWVQFTIGIGSDEVAYITMTKEGLELLCERNGINYETAIRSKAK